MQSNGHSREICWIVDEGLGMQGILTLGVGFSAAGRSKCGLGLGAALAPGAGYGLLPRQKSLQAVDGFGWER